MGRGPVTMTAQSGQGTPWPASAATGVPPPFNICTIPGKAGNALASKRCNVCVHPSQDLDIPVKTGNALAGQCCTWCVQPCQDLHTPGETRMKGPGFILHVQQSQR